MKIMELKVLATVICVVTTLVPTAALKCYSCMWTFGQGNKKCLQEPPPSKFLTECSYPQCWKLIAGYENGTVTSVQRFCIAVARHDTSTYCRGAETVDEVTGDAIRKVECVCNTAGCNGEKSTSATNNAFTSQSIRVLLIVWIMVGLKLN